MKGKQKQLPYSVSFKLLEMKQNSRRIEDIVKNLDMTYSHLDMDIQRQIAWLYLKCQLDRDSLGIGWILKKVEELIDEAKVKLDRQRIIP